MISARILADSMSPAGHRLTTMEVTMPRFLAAEFNTHRAFSRNAASSRAIPVERTIANVQKNPYVPTTWTSNQPGMVGGEPLTGIAADEAAQYWREACDYALLTARQMDLAGIHKQHVNRLLEPFMWHSVIVSATDWDNFFTLRCSPDAQPEFRLLAEEMRYQRSISTPCSLDYGEYHLPYVGHLVGSLLFPTDVLRRVAVAKCARVSYNRHNRHNDAKTIEEDVSLYDRLLASGHLSPFEHVARPAKSFYEVKGNFTGWVQHRHEVAQ